MLDGEFPPVDPVKCVSSQISSPQENHFLEGKRTGLAFLILSFVSTGGNLSSILNTNIVVVTLQGLQCFVLLEALF